MPREVVEMGASKSVSTSDAGLRAVHSRLLAEHQALIRLQSRLEEQAHIAAEIGLADQVQEAHISQRQVSERSRALAAELDQVGRQLAATEGLAAELDRQAAALRERETQLTALHQTAEAEARIAEAMAAASSQAERIRQAESALAERLLRTRARMEAMQELVAQGANATSSAERNRQLVRRLSGEAAVAAELARLKQEASKQGKGDG